MHKRANLPASTSTITYTKHVYATRSSLSNTFTASYSICIEKTQIKNCIYQIYVLWVPCDLQSTAKVHLRCLESGGMPVVPRPAEAIQEQHRSTR